MARGAKPDNKTRMLVWGRAAGHCQYPGCSKRLDEDLVAGDLRKNNAYLAHIIASDPGGERGDPTLSHELSNDPDNIMLMCDAHHREIDDRKKKDRYTVGVLRRMKQQHEDRVAQLFSNPLTKPAHVLRVAASIGENETSIPLSDCIEAMGNEFYLADRRPIDIQMRDIATKDSDPDYYPTVLKLLRSKYDREIKGRFEEGDLQHLAIFGFAPMPVLMELGRLLSDLSAVSVYGKHREPKPGWAWPDDHPPLGFSMAQGSTGPKKVALKLSVSAEITDERVLATYETDEVSIWEIRSDRLGTSELRNQGDLSVFRQVVGKAFDAIKDQHGMDVELSVFPAVPAACAIEFGRTWQPKAHPGFKVFDQVPGQGFIERHLIHP
ncbi:SAVED domain-containing protein [Primorskyibacter marinus]|uniref:SAVED domain-containing protein n=1 Tax=Primorskyibacter marinus TaxID=1977320 RepID=UPI000E302665|nr:SAVED domain-containing protein [Primorskyibacter marinus]